MEILIYPVIAYVGVVVAVTVYLVRWLEPLRHERYNGVHVYAVDSNGTYLHVQRPLLTLYMDIKDERVHPISGKGPAKPREIKLWTFTLGIPGVLSPLVRTLRGR